MRLFSHFVFKFSARFSGAHYVIAAWDTEAGVWYVQESSVRGLSAEAQTAEGLMDKLKFMIPELLELNDDSSKGGHRSIPIRATFEECFQANV